MNNRQLYLAWLRTVAPSVYSQAVRRATGGARSLGGLADDLVQRALAPNLSHSFLGDDSSMLDPITVTAIAPDSGPITTNYSFDTSMPAFDPNSVAMPSFAPIDTGTATGLTAPASSGGSTFANILTAVTAIGAGVLNYSTQSKLVTLNTTRAQQGLPPVNAQGQVVSPYGLTSTSPTMLAFERSISGATGGSMLPIILGMLGLGAFFVLRHKKA
ncbi:MAG: hypothetical protein ACRETL_06955 [Gammaproteobacteria bacterium]